MDKRLAYGNSESLTVEQLIAGLSSPIQQRITDHLGAKPSLSLAQRLQSMGCHYEARLVLQLLVEAEPNNTQALYQLGLAFNRAGKKQQAKEYIQRYYQQRMLANGMEPKNNPEILQYLLSTEGFAVAPEQIPSAYIENLFDRCSSEFDEQLLKKLEYKVPEMLFEFFCHSAKSQKVFKNCKEIVDLGCGTGLAGKYFTSICQRLTGVDLSSEMLEKARETGVYSNLVVSEIMAYLKSHTLSVDIFIATDVFIYFGNIEPLLRACRKQQQSTGLLAFSVESLAPVNPKTPFKLASTGRFQHHQQYVRDSANNAGYTVLSCTEAVLRRESGCDVNGYLFVLVAE